MSDTIWEIKECLENALYEQVSRNMDGLNVDEAGKVTDMIKDLAQAAKYSAEACYYKTVTKAMPEEHEESEGQSKTEHSWTANDHMNSLRDMYKMADTAMKKQMKADVGKLLSEMPA